MKYLALVVVIALGGVAYLVPQNGPPEFEPLAALNEPPVTVCAVEEGSGRTTEVSVLSVVDGDVGLTLFASGSPAGNITIRTGSSGSVTVPIVDIAAVGRVAGLVEMPVAESAAGSVIKGAGSLSAESCQVVPGAQTFISGGSTIGDETFELQLMNPYAGEAIVDLAVQSEAGIETNERFESVIVPSRSSTFVDFSDLVPGRESLSILVETLAGRVIAVGRQGVAGDSAVWNAVPAVQDWLIPIPKSSSTRRLVIATPSATAVDYQIDLYSTDGLVEAFDSGALPPRGQVAIDLAEFTDEAAGVRVVSTGPVVATLWIESDLALSVTTASPEQANRWLLPGASAPEGGGWATVVILNSGLEDAEINLRALRENSTARSFILESDSVVELGLETADGYLIEATGPVVVLWTAQRGDATSAAIGLPLDDG